MGGVLSLRAPRSNLDSDLKSEAGEAEGEWSLTLFLLFRRRRERFGDALQNLI
jgi:hypothetical protein